MERETIQTWFGLASRLVGDNDSRVLALLPDGIHPSPEPACATCPAKDWYLTRKGLRCYCSVRGVISWTSNDDPVLACDARERLIEEADARARGTMAA